MYITGCWLFNIKIGKSKFTRKIILIRCQDLVLKILALEVKVRLTPISEVYLDELIFNLQD